MSLQSQLTKHGLSISEINTTANFTLLNRNNDYGDNVGKRYLENNILQLTSVMKWVLRPS